MSLLSLDPAWEEEARIQGTSHEWRAWLKCIMSRDDDGPREILQDPRGAKFAPYQPHPKDPDALVSEFYPRRDAPGANVWLVEVTFSTDVDVTSNPIGMPAVVTRETQLREIPAVFDVDGNPLLNTAGDLMTDPPAVRKQVDQVFKIQKNLPLNLPDWTDTHPGCVNSDSIRLRGRTYQPGTMFFAALSIGAEMNVPGSTDTISTLRGTPYTTADLELWWRADGWIEYYPNRGFFQLIPKGNLKFPKNAEIPGGRLAMKQLKGAFNKLPPYQRARCTVGPLQDLPSEPVFLDANGQMIINPTFADVIAIAYDGFQKQAFSVLPLK